MVTVAQQECPSARQLVQSLRQVEEMFAAHEASYQQSLRALRKKIGALHNSTTAVFKAAGETPPRGGNVKLLLTAFFYDLFFLFPESFIVSRSSQAPFDQSES